MSEELQELTLRNGWTAVLTPTQLTLSDAKSGESYAFERATAAAEIERFGLTFDSPFIVIRKPKRRAVRVRLGQVPILNDWFGPDYSAELRNQLNNRMRFGIPIGFLYIATSGLSAVWIGLGLILVIEAILARKSPHSYLFLLEALFWATLMVQNSLSFAEKPGPLSFVFFLLNLFFFASAIRLYLAFRKIHRVPRVPAVP